VHFAGDAAEAREIILDILSQAGARRVVKTKSMATEEIELNPALEAAGMEVTETDLGEYIIQLTGEKPTHIITPAIHMTREQVSELFHERLGTPRTRDIPALTRAARVILREKFLRADAGITGANFAVAEAGALMIVTNEGNGRFVTSLPRVLISVAGFEKMVERFSDIPPLLRVLPSSATGQRLTVYTSLLAGPRRPGETDGPEECHVVLLDNGRSRILGSPSRDILLCIKCGACLNACPVYRSVGGHAYGATYPGPVGSVLTPLLDGRTEHPCALPHASTLCGACAEICPVKIDLPHLLISLRADPGVCSSGWMGGAGEALMFRVWAWACRHPKLYRWGAGLLRAARRVPGMDRIARLILPPVRNWAGQRTLPLFPDRFGWEQDRSDHSNEAQGKYGGPVR
jgi:L-lactate dehydrogenase complex protein LldF